MRHILLSEARHITSICGASDARLTSVSPLSGRCPRCGQGHLYAGVLTIAPRCSKCGLDFTALDTGDGAIAFVVLILGAVAVTLAILTEILFAPALLGSCRAVGAVGGGRRDSAVAAVEGLAHHTTLPARGDVKARRSLLWPSVFWLSVFLVLVALGTWQIQRLHWKEGLIAERQATVSSSPSALPDAQTALNRMEFHHVKFTGKFLNQDELYRHAIAADGKPGFHVVTPFQLDNGDIVFVDRGFVPEDRRDPATRAAGEIAGATNVTGLLRLPETASSWFTPANEPGKTYGSRWICQRWQPPAISPTSCHFMSMPTPCRRPAAIRSAGRPQPTCQMTTCNMP